ncbi:xanthine dehydrogenase-like isoform X2 [Contarinia nasturtii]|uniref:xanthine dehydrogenase-like isoform X2 n=1 Tax=Contarinia nasturtii TaxID=265458 RepID=UPI0012D40018|nr:xanthine dehydrogenase-like isoform X2 [Contarinia nasturtii]
MLFLGQPCGMIVANSMALANYAASQVKITYKKIRGKEPLVTGQLLSVIDSLRDKENDDGAAAAAASEEDQTVEIESDSVFISGEFEVGTQYHYPMEPQTTFAAPSDDGGLNVYTASQGLDMVQMGISQSLKIPENKINIVVKRVGGAYGSKIARSSLVACACALACYLTNRPVRFVMTIEAMMSICGKRYPCANKYELALDPKTGKIRRLTNFYIEDYGYSLNEMNDESVLQAFLLSYVSKRWKYSGKPLLTNTNISNWCRAPGSVESIAMIETIIEHIAHKLKLDPVQVRLNNLERGDVWKSTLEQILVDIDYYERRKEVDRYNARNRWRKRGIGFIQMKYPIVYVGPFSAYVAIYHGDGTVIVSHGGIEVGQGINTKSAQIAAFALNIPVEMVQVKASNNETAPNSFYTAANVASDSVCLATKRACEILLKRIKPIRDRMPENAKWQEIVEACHQNYVDLTARHTFFPIDAKPYFVYGCACAEIEWDSLTGNQQIQRVDLIEDTGRSLSPLIDCGQVEGSFVMGLGYWLTEKYVYNRLTGQLVTNRTWNYKVPGAKDIPIDFRVKFIETENTNNRVGVLRSKATGEPAVALSHVVVCALRHALQSVLKDNGQADQFLPLGSGLTPDELCLAAPVNMGNFLID